MWLSTSCSDTFFFPRLCIWRGMKTFSSELDWSLVAGAFGSSPIFVHLWSADSTWLSCGAVINTAGLIWHWENAENPLWYSWEQYCSGSLQNCRMLVRHSKNSVMRGQEGEGQNGVVLSSRSALGFVGVLSKLQFTASLWCDGRTCSWSLYHALSSQWFDISQPWQMNLWLKSHCWGLSFKVMWLLYGPGCYTVFSDHIYLSSNLLMTSIQDPFSHADRCRDWDVMVAPLSEEETWCPSCFAELRWR